MGARVRAVIGVALLVALIGGLPGMASAAPAPRVVTVATYDIEPFVMTRDGIKSGFTIDLLEEIAKRTGWTYRYVDGSNVRGILDDVLQKKVDSAAAAISITSDRSQVMDFSQPSSTPACRSSSRSAPSHAPSPVSSTSSSCCSPRPWRSGCWPRWR